MVSQSFQRIDQLRESSHVTFPGVFLLTPSRYVLYVYLQTVILHTAFIGFEAINVVFQKNHKGPNSL